jgi:hypothetical protein
MRKIFITAVLATAILALPAIPEVDSHKLSASASQAQSDSIVFSTQRDGNQEVYSLGLRADAASTGAPPIQGGTSTAIKIGLVDNSKYQYRDGCGCSFWPVNKTPKFDDPRTWKYLLVGNYDKQAWMNINSQIIQLRLTKDTIRYKGRNGDRYQQTYQSGDITANVECIATGFGDTHSVDCNATITVAKGNQKQVVKAIGSCGC